MRRTRGPPATRPRTRDWTATPGQGARGRRACPAEGAVSSFYKGGRVGPGGVAGGRGCRRGRGTRVHPLVPRPECRLRRAHACDLKPPVPCAPVFACPRTTGPAPLEGSEAGKGAPGHARLHTGACAWAVCVRGPQWGEAGCRGSRGGPGPAAIRSLSPSAWQVWPPYPGHLRSGTSL